MNTSASLSLDPDHKVRIRITGAGPVGSTLALLLAARMPDPASVCLIGTFPTEDGSRHARHDPRVLALNQGSRALLESLKAWPSEAADIGTVHVSQQGHLGRTLIQHADFNIPRLGSVVSYDALTHSLHEAIRHSGITWLSSREARIASAHETPQLGTDATNLSSATTVHVQSDGRATSGWHRRYDQYAVLSTVQASRPLPGWAFERFTPRGPLALLPHPAQTNWYSLVWCTTPEHASSLVGMADNAFDAALQAQFGNRLGVLHGLGKRSLFPLSLQAAPVLPYPGTVVIGNAAQTLHPVAGQGLNLGLRDAAQLAQALTPWLRNPLITPDSCLERYQQMRRADRWLTLGITDALPRVFTTRNPIVQHMAGAGLLALDLVRGIRSPLAKQLLMGLRS